MSTGEIPKITEGVNPSLPSPPQKNNEVLDRISAIFDNCKFFFIVLLGVAAVAVPIHSYYLLAGVGVVAISVIALSILLGCNSCDEESMDGCFVSNENDSRKILEDSMQWSHLPLPGSESVNISVGEYITQLRNRLNLHREEEVNLEKALAEERKKVGAPATNGEGASVAQPLPEKGKAKAFEENAAVQQITSEMSQIDRYNTSCSSLIGWLESTLLGKFEIYCSQADGSCFFDSLSLSLLITLFSMKEGKNDLLDQIKDAITRVYTDSTNLKKAQETKDNQDSLQAWHDLIVYLKEANCISDILTDKRKVMKGLFRQLIVKFMQQKTRNESGAAEWWTATSEANEDAIGCLRGGEIKDIVHRGQGVVDYQEKMAKQHEWADNLVVAAFNALFEGMIYIKLYLKGINEPLIFFLDKDAKMSMPTDEKEVKGLPFYLCYLPNHYVALAPQPS